MSQINGQSGSRQWTFATFALRAGVLLQAAMMVKRLIRALTRKRHVAMNSISIALISELPNGSINVGIMKGKPFGVVSEKSSLPSPMSATAMKRPKLI